MADREPGAMLMAELPTSSHIRCRGITTATDSACTSDEMDSDCDENILSTINNRNAHSPVIITAAKRNKRKNFQPRNIAYNENDDNNADTECYEKSRRSSESSNSEFALDLSSNDVIVPNRLHCKSSKNKNNNNNNGNNVIIEDHNNSKDASSYSPIDLSYNKNNNQDYNSDDSDSDCDENQLSRHSIKKFIHKSPNNHRHHNHNHYHNHHRNASYFHHQPPENSDLKEYAQNTVKELLEIYGLNSDTVTDVAQTITNNLPISHFSTGKILESLSLEREKSYMIDGKASQSSLMSPLSHAEHISNSIHHSSSSPVPRMALPQNMAAILAIASMKEQLKLQNSNRLSTETNNSGLTGLPSNSPPSFKDNKITTINTVDYSRYVKRYATAADCGNGHCKDLNYREHFHCMDCNSRVFIKKEEMIRHFKWHKKRDESLQHGFMRYSPSDDCSDRFQNCTHNRKQTHYHCIQNGCDKVYISTSDVQMHANYHRKDSAIIQEGFQRLRATEECRTPYCAFYGQRTTHFHCRRDQCQFTFKNKADMEKHKTYHIKDEQLARDGFKKFLKPDACGFSGCKFSQVCNHIHCVRDGCSYVLHSSGQLLSHKRKHERKDTETAYRKFKLSQQNVSTYDNIDQSSQHSDTTPLSPSNSLQFLQQTMTSSFSGMNDGSYSNSSSEGGRASPVSSVKSSARSSMNAMISAGGYFTENSSPMDFSMEDSSECFYRYINQYQGNELCENGPKCSLNNVEHFHCKDRACDISFRTRDTAESHARLHETQERLSDSLYQESSVFCQQNGNCPPEKHYHCTWDGCYEAILSSDRLDHLRHHEISSNQYNSLDALFRRKRGRPPKNRIIEVWNDYGATAGNDSPQAIFTSFKLPKPSTGAFSTNSQQPDIDVPSPPSPKPASQKLLELHKFQEYIDGCPDMLCAYSSVPLHYHCRRPRCFFATDMENELILHSTEFHEKCEIKEGYVFFDSSVDCRVENCHSNRVSRHFHCVQRNCSYSFVKYADMAEHSAKEHSISTEINSQSNSNKETEIDVKEEPVIREFTSPEPEHMPFTSSPNRQTPLSSSELTASSRPTVKASGTFYPLCGISNTRNPSPPSIIEERLKSDGQMDVSMSTLIPDWLQPERHERFTVERPCCRAFCKLKRKEHYHCNACNQAFSEIDRLKPHILKHGPNAMIPFGSKPENNNNDDPTDAIIHHAGVAGLPLVLDTDMIHPMASAHYPGGFGAAMAAAQQLAMISSQGLPFIPHSMPALYTSPSGLMFATPPGFTSTHPSSILGNGILDTLPRNSKLQEPSDCSRRSLSPNPESPEVKKARIQNSMRILKDEPVPEGYVRFRFNEDCHYTHCGYREHQTHFHCVRQDCGYSFCDKTRFVQHTARHERLDTLMGGDFQQYRANVSCGRIDCAYATAVGTGQNKASHFHCLKCEFVCTDTNKVVAHRRQHQKLDSIMAAGFEKFTPSQSCSQADSCVHSGKQTHYHCLSCQYAVLGLSQMTAHKYRHLE